jgi:hypothetical protein
MVNWEQFTLSSVLASVFTPENPAFAGGRVVATLLQRFGKRFDGEMQVLPSSLTQSAPSGLDYPHITLNSSDGSWQVTAAPGRFNCVRSSSGTDTALGVEHVTRECVEIVENYLREMRVSAGRLGLVVQRVCPNENPAQTLITRFCDADSQIEPFNRSANFEIHNHKRYQPDHQGVDYQINSWVRCQSSGTYEPNKTPAIMVAQDLNTLAEDGGQTNFDVERTTVFFQMASNEAESIIKKYFPDGERQ